MTFFSNSKRKDYVLNPRGKALYDDSNRFGTKMLEKMGWSKGKGLGANLDGQLEFIKVSHKGDQKGVGFKDRDDQWTIHESNFSSLLNSFKSSENSDEESRDFVVQHFQSDDQTLQKESVEEKKELFSGVSLEEQSKKSRARVHYKKFTRGKDLSRYSEKDLANIFGKKSLESKVEVEVSTSGSNEDETVEKLSKNTPNFGITTVETGTTINDYFKNKMKNIVNGLIQTSDEKSTNVETISDVPKEKKGRKKSKKRDPEVGDANVEINENPAAAEPSEQVTNADLGSRQNDGDLMEEFSKKKRKTSMHTEAFADESEKPFDIKETSTASKKSKKSKKEKLSDSTEVGCVGKTDKPKKNKNESVTEEDCQIVNETQSNYQTKKSKRSKTGDGKTEECSSVDSQQIHLSRKNKRKNGTVAGDCDQPHKKSKKDEEIVQEVINILDDEPVNKKKLSKKSKENKKVESPSLQKSTNLFDLVVNTTEESSPNLAEVVTDNVYKIRRYRTEIFRYVDLEAFPGSTLCHIPGYGYTSEMTLKIIDKPDDSKLINTLWDQAQDKYANVKNKKQKFVARIKGLHKKNIFEI